MAKLISLLLISCVFVMPALGQYTISGFIDTEEAHKTIYISLLRYDEERTIHSDQVLFSTQTDSSGYFAFSGELLSLQNKLYRIHTNRTEESRGLQIYGDGETRNYHNFIFSNTDTIFFPKEASAWFGESQNTNESDQQWRALMAYRDHLLDQYSETRNDEAILQANLNFANALKSYCRDSVNDPLVELLALAQIESTIENLKPDFNNDADFYYDLLARLNVKYDGTSYHQQFQEEVAKFASARLRQSYLRHKRLNYVLGSATLILIAVVWFVVLQLRRTRRQNVTNQVFTLTAQELKVARSICDGMSNKEIASELFISMSTLKSHIRSLYAKVGVSSRQQLKTKLKKHPWD